jgi:hypothetical protein
LKKFLEFTGIADKLQYRDRRIKQNADSLEDVFDGEKYKALQQPGQVLSNPNNYSYVFNTDGFRLGKSAKLHAWPLLVRLNELPPNLRQKYIFLGGLWVGTKSPNMTTFLEPFVRQANKLSSDGLRWRPGGQEEVQSRFFPLCLCVDAMARFPMLAMSSPTSHYGCTFCNIQGVHDGDSIRYPILPYPEMPPYEARTRNVMMEQMLQVQMALENGEQIKIEGIAGISALANLDHFDISEGNAMDDLHPIFEGAAKFHTDILIETVGAMTKAEKERIINLRLRSIKAPREMSRKELVIESRGSWKGSQWRSWLINVGPQCLQGLVPQHYIQHFELLSYLAYLVTKKSIDIDELRGRGSQCVLLYVTQFQEKFGLGKMKYTIHVLLHLIDSVLRYAQTWTCSTMNFESWNHRLLQSVTSPNGVMDQMIVRHLLSLQLNKSMFSEEDLSEDIVKKLHSILDKPRHDAAVRVGEHYLLGQSSQRVPTPEEIELLPEEYLPCEQLTVFTKVMSRQGFLYQVQRIEGNAVHSDNSIVCSWEDSFGTIQDIVLLDNGDEQLCGCFVSEHTISHRLTRARHIQCLHDETSLTFLKMDEVKCPAVKIKVQGDIYLSPFENNHEID